jgi:C4-dicarboxylate transporter DctQ subunit
MVNRVLDHLEEWLITFLIGAATVVIFVSVAHRYATGFATGGLQDALLKIDLAWAQELCIYMFVWMAKFGAAYGVRTGIHVGVDVLINALKPKVRAPLIVFGLLGGALFTGVIGTFGAHFVWELAFTDQTSPDLELPKWIVYACVPLGSFLMCYRFLQVCWSFIKTGHLPHAEHAHVEGLEKEAELEWAVMPSGLHPKDDDITPPGERK